MINTYLSDLVRYFILHKQTLKKKSFLEKLKNINVQNNLHKIIFSFERHFGHTWKFSGFFLALCSRFTPGDPFVDLWGKK